MEYWNSAKAWSAWELSTLKLLADPDAIAKASDPKWYSLSDCFPSS